MRRLTVLSVAFPFAPITADSVGGAEQILARIDRALVASGHRSIVLAAEGSTAAGELLAIPQPPGEIGPQDWANARVFLRRVMPELIKTHRVDILHMHSLDYHSCLPLPGVPVLATLHLPHLFYPPEALDPKRPRTWINSVSSQQQKLVEALSHRIIGFIENGVPVGPANTKWRKRDYALAIGRICPEKGFHLAIDAAKRAGVPLWLAGGVFPYPDHQRYCREEIMPRLDRSRRWIGPVSKRRKQHLLESARCVLIPSLVPETASLVAREALAAGTPVVAFPQGALVDVVDHEHTGFLVRDVEEMASAILKSDRIDPEACRETARDRFSVHRMTREYISLYDRLSKAR